MNLSVAKLLIFALKQAAKWRPFRRVTQRLPGQILFLRRPLFIFTVMYKKQLTKEQALQKLKHYCGYQERCHSDVKEKLYQLGVWKKDHDALIAALIEQGYLNEERFAIAFAGGRFRMKEWGRVKIKYELKQKQVSDYSIKKALKQINEEEYTKLLKRLAEEKYASLKGEQWMVRKKKTMDYLMQRGFEPGLVSGMMNSLKE
jgi:regulatory protein